MAASFTRTADDVREMRKLLDENGGSSINIIAKIENQQGVDNIDAIIEEADGIMVARGDMGVEIPLERVPIIQQRIIQKVYQAGKVVITATQMLDSMMVHPRRPVRRPPMWQMRSTRGQARSCSPARQRQENILWKR